MSVSVTEHLPAVRTVVIPGLKKDGVDIADTCGSYNQDQEEGGNGDNHDLANLPNSENEHDEREDRNFWQNVPSAETTGSKATRIVRFIPMITPRKIPGRAPRAKPAKIRNKLTQRWPSANTFPTPAQSPSRIFSGRSPRCPNKAPLWIRSQRAIPTVHGAGKRASSHFRATASCQKASNKTGKPMERRRSRVSFSECHRSDHTCRSIVFLNLSLQVLPDRMGRPAEFRRTGQGKTAGATKGNPKLTLVGSGVRCH